MPKSKQTDVGGLTIVFDQRAKGEETPFWIGRVLRGEVEIGTFKNHGRGGATIIQPPALVEELRGLVDQADPVFGPTIIERENVPLLCADIRAYARGGKQVTLANVVSEFKSQKDSQQ